MYTSHGHHIPGTINNDDRPAQVARCGGPGLCKVCMKEAQKFYGGERLTMANVDTMKVVDVARKAKLVLLEYLNQWDKVDADPANMYVSDDIAVVWSAKVLGNWKAMLFLPERPGKYYEVTYDGAKKQAYLDVYKKNVNLVVKD